MFDTTARTELWRDDIPAIIAELDAAVRPSLLVARKRKRKLKPTWEE